MSYAQPERFCLMLYRSASGKEHTIWNSRNGVTPFVVFLEDEEFQHVEWGRDVRRPEYTPKVGEYVFVTLTESQARKNQTAIVEAHWDKPDSPYSMKDHFESKDVAIGHLVAQDMVGKQPHMVQVTEEWLAGFLAGRENQDRSVRLVRSRHG